MGVPVKVILEELLFDQPTVARVAMDLLAIFRLGFQQRHAVVLGFNRGAGSPFEAWLGQRPDYEQDLIEAALRYGLQAEGRLVLDSVVHVVPGPQPQWAGRAQHLPPDQAAELLARPLELLIEDEENDQAFLRAVAMGPQAEEFYRFLERSWICFRHGGGIPGMKRQIASRARQPEVRVRTFAIFDRDALAPREMIKASQEEPTQTDPSQELEDLCTQEVVPHHCLWRRAMENYLPPAFLLERLKGEALEPVARAFRELRDPRQRHHYNMKAGFEGDQERLRQSPRSIQDAVTELFDGVDRRGALIRGFGRDVGDRFKTENGRRPAGLTEAMLREDGIGAEMQQLLERIMESA